jgi:hypothetical protein
LEMIAVVETTADVMTAGVMTVVTIKAWTN